LAATISPSEIIRHTTMSSPATAWQIGDSDRRANDRCGRSCQAVQSLASIAAADDPRSSMSSATIVPSKMLSSWSGCLFVAAQPLRRV
jgi:hypothetical protein